MTLCRAARELAFLLERGYPEESALRFVGDHHQLPLDQRRMLARALSRFSTASHRRAKRITGEDVAGRRLLIDGYNVLITAESLLEGRVVVLGADGALRDIASLRRSAGPVRRDAVVAVCDAIVEAAPSAVTWYFDSPVSGSGDLAVSVRRMPHPGIDVWDALAVRRVDEVLVEQAGVASGTVVASSDALVLDRVESWWDLAGDLASGLGVEPLRLLDQSG